MVKSARGRDVNMQALKIANQKTVALGNAKMNARGDLLGKNGKIVKTREQLAQEYNKTPPSKVTTVAVSKTTLAQTKPRDTTSTPANAQQPIKKKQVKAEKVEKTE